MAARGGGIPGIALTMATAGGFLLYIGIRNVPLVEGLKAMLKGKVPTPRPKKNYGLPTVFSGGTLTGGISGKTPGLSSAASAAGAKIVQAALRYRGEPYSWGGAVPRSAGGPGFDCSGFVTWVLHHDLGMDLPDNNHTVTQQFYGWSGADDRTREQCSAGDLVCYPQHMGIAISNTQMIHAPTFGQDVQIGNIWGAFDLKIRRVKG